MVYITLHPDEVWTLDDLGRLVEPAEISDANGRLLGIFVPANLERGKRLYAESASKIDAAEIQRRMQSNEPGVPMAVVLKRLKLLEAEMQRRKAAGTRDFTPDEALQFFHSLISTADRPAE